MSNFAHTPRPSCSPWGAIQQADQLIPGAWLVSTATHGGILLSDERQAAMPDALRITEPAYEEACDWSLPILAFQDEFVASPSCRSSWITLARDIARCWHPDRFTGHTGEAVPENPSHILRSRAAYQLAIGKFCVTSAWGSWAEWVPDGKVGVMARKVTAVDHLGHASYDDEERYALVPKDRYDSSIGVNCLDDLDAEIIDKPTVR
ncbi:DUF7007 domain-containing protein [Croceicoccus hydrothermalis]|uniref:DUF7007 domain-containing protein n=1 Tax=Croceicoccus hydrothermalis TaxID=2867964 RepID=UPI001EFB0A5D|nr:hypothetical protein [Croceicoccus hydrothermalis]